MPLSSHLKIAKCGIRIGTDRPEEVAEAVKAKITDVQAGSFYEKSGKRGIFFTVTLLAAFILILIVIFMSGRKDAELTFSDSGLTISGMYGLTINYADIIQADTLTAFPGIRTRTDGFASGGILKGHFKLQDQSKVMLFIRKGIAPYILIKTRETTIYLNFGNPAKTREVYAKIGGRPPATGDLEE